MSPLNSAALWVSWTSAPFIFLSQMFWGLVSSAQIPWVGVPDVGHQPLCPLEKHQAGETLPCCLSLCRGWGFWLRLCVYLSCPSGVFLPVVVEKQFSSFQREVPLCSCGLGVAVGGGLRTFLQYHLVPNEQVICSSLENCI